MSKPHSLVKLKVMPFMMCNSCGLVILKNMISDWCRRQGCDYDEHPDYERKMRTLA